MKQQNIKKLVLTALFAALICVATMLIEIPMPATQGYVNLGDCFVLLGAAILGPIYGAFAGGIGSALADLLAGYAHYIPGTLLIKAVMATIAALLMRTLGRRNFFVGQIVAGVAAELFMVFGYFVYAMLILGKGIAAAAGIPGNLLQGAVGIAAAFALSVALRRSKLFETNKVKANG